MNLPACRTWGACSVLKGHDFSRAETAPKMRWALQAAEKLTRKVLCNKGTASAGPQAAVTERPGFSPCSTGPATQAGWAKSPVLGPGTPAVHTVSAQFRLLALLAIAVLPPSLAAPAQTPLFRDPSQPGPKTQQVQYLYPEQVTLAAGKPQSVTLHFRIAPGLHINSHTPSDQFLIPTVLSLPANAGVSLAAAHYPDGVEYILPADPSTKLNVYTGDFAIEARLLATPGDHLVQAHLRFQACDENACMPPRTITAAIDVIAR